VVHFLDLVDERANGFEKRAEVRAAAKSMFMSVDRIPLQSHDVARRILDTARDLVGLAMLVQLEHPCGFFVGALERVALLSGDYVTDVLHDHSSVPSVGEITI
jgi:hypothetical protein